MRLLVVVMIFVLFLLLRRDRVLTLNVANPDEAELLASGRRAIQSLVPFDRFTSPTYGPVWALSLGLLGRLGFPLSLPLAHLLSALIAACSCALAAYVTSRLVDLKFAVLRLTPLVLLWGIGFNHEDYWSLSTELLPMLIIVCGCSIARLGWNSRRWVLVGASLVGFGSWSKYLFGLVGLAILLCFAVRLCRCGVRWYVALLGVLLASNVINITLYLVALIKGVPVDSVVESMKMTLDYIRGGGAGGMGEIPPVSFSSRFSSLGWNLLTFFPLAPLALHSFRDSLIRVRQRTIFNPIQVETAGWGGILIVVSGLVTLCASPIIFPHYNYVLITACLAAFIIRLPNSSNGDGELDAPAALSGSTRLDRLDILSLCIALLIITPAIRGTAVLEPSISAGQIFDARSNRWERAFDEEGNPLSDLCGPGTYSFVWGWSPQVYAFYDWQPASRFVAPAGMIDGNNLNLEVEPLREKLTQELLAEPPACIVDAIGPSFFPGYGPEASMRVQMPSLWNQLSADGVEKVYYWDRVNPFLVIARGSQTPILEP